MWPDRRFGNLVLWVKASDYDYIISKMPPLTQISITARLARFMDKVLLVIGFEKTNRDAFSHARELLAEGKATFKTVLGRTRAYMLGWLQQG